MPIIIKHVSRTANVIKNIKNGNLYIIMGTLGGSLGSAYSFLIRIELGIPG